MSVDVDDVFRVTPNPDRTVFEVEHLAVSRRDEEGHVTHHRFCCRQTVTVTDADRAGAETQTDAEVRALTRGNAELDRRHA